MNKVYALVSTDTPRIFPGSWNSLRHEWRWVTNFPIREHRDTTDFIRQLQEQHGRENVAVGAPFVQDAGPIYERGPFGAHLPTTFGVYVRDVETWIDDFMAAMDAYESTRVR